LKLLKILLTDKYFLSASDGLFFSKKVESANSHTSHRNRLPGKRLAAHVESFCMKLDRDFLVRFTGGELLTLRGLHNEEKGIC